MTASPMPDSDQRTWARVAGLMYLLAIPPAIFAEFYVMDKLVDSKSALVTASNIAANTTLFRLGTASNLLVFAMDIVLITALYVSLKPVSRNLAVLAAFWGIIETSVLVAALLNDFDVLRIVGNASYLRAFEPDRIAALARLSIGAHGSGYNVGLVFAGLRSTLFCWLWLKSGYVPKLLAGFGVFASALLGAVTFTLIVFPDVAKVVTVNVYGNPIFFFELMMGFWLLIKGASSRPQHKGSVS